MAKLLAELTTDEVERLDKSQTVVMIPIASIEQHGPHLPLGTDTMILEGVLKEVMNRSEDLPLLVTPLLPIGKSNEHMPFKGTLTLSYQTLLSIVTDIVRSIARHGFKKVVIFNSHGGNTEVLTSLSRDLRDEFEIQAYVIDWWFTDFWADILAKYQESPRDGVFHAGELESSLMLALRPELVKIDLFKTSFPREKLRNNRYVTILGPVTMGWRSNDITDSGVIGDPTKATAEKGRIFLDFAADKIVDIVKEIMSM